MRSPVACLVVMSLLGSSVLWAESLGEIAEREKERRKGQTEGKVMTESDLGRAKGKTLATPDDGMPSSAPVATAAAAPAEAKTADGKPAPKPKTEEELRADKEKDWRTRYERAQADLEQAQKNVRELEPGSFSNATQAARLEEARGKVAAAQATLNALDEERRANGFRQ